LFRAAIIEQLVSGDYRKRKEVFIQSGNKIQNTGADFMEFFISDVSSKNQVMKKSIFVAVAVLGASAVFAQKKEKQPPPPPPPPVVIVNEAPPPPPPPKAKEALPKDYQAFLKRNPTVKGIDWNNSKVRIRLKSGKEETFDMNNKEDVERLKNQYGELPAPPPPPPPPPAPKAPNKISQA
jgi:hypothetical protein